MGRARDTTTANQILWAAEEFTLNFNRGPTVTELSETLGIPRNTIYYWIPYFRENGLADWEPDTCPRRLLIAGNGPTASDRSKTCSPIYHVTGHEWREILKFFHYRCAWCGSWGDKLVKHEVPRLPKDFPWTDFGRNESWTGIVVPACKRCAAKSHDDGWLKANADPDCLWLVWEWVGIIRRESHND